MRDRRVWHEMTLPISKYHIYSSHNTYLDGHQMKSESTPLMYKRVIMQGCRCVEVDCWDRGPASNPVPTVTHGWTMCGEVPALDVAEAIRDAYAALPEEQRTPLVISLEMHCKLEGQQRLAQIFIDTFGEMLERPPRDGRLGSPAELMGKILLKGKTCGHRGSVNQTSSQRCTSSRATDATGNFADVEPSERSGNLEGSMSMSPTSPGGSGRLAAPPMASATSGRRKSSEQGEDRKSAEKGANGLDVGYARMRGELMLLPSSSTLPDGVGDVGSCEVAELRSFANGEAPQLVLHARGEDPMCRRATAEESSAIFGRGSGGLGSLSLSGALLGSGMKALAESSSSAEPSPRTSPRASAQLSRPSADSSRSIGGDPLSPGRTNLSSSRSLRIR